MISDLFFFFFVFGLIGWFIVIYSRHPLGEFYSTAEMQSMYSSAPSTGLIMPNLLS